MSSNCSRRHERGEEAVEHRYASYVAAGCLQLDGIHGAGESERSCDLCVGTILVPTESFCRDQVQDTPGHSRHLLYSRQSAVKNEK